MLNDCFSPLTLLISYFHPQFLSSACYLLLMDPVSKQSLTGKTYLAVFFMTCTLEAPIYWLGLRRHLKPRAILGAIFILNFATHPLVTWIFPGCFSKYPFLTQDYLLSSEVFAILIEAFLLLIGYKIPLKKAFLVSFCANVFSWWIGLYLAAIAGL